MWWRDGVLYQVYPRSFCDSNGDGIGDLQGIVQKLDHLEWLGIEGLWLNPTFPSPNRDWGFDVSDYRGVHPDLGTQEDLDELIAQAARRGIHVMLDLVPNHTSDQHAWFVESRSSRDAAKRDWYVWADPAPGGGPPNNWLAVFGGPAWELDEATGQYYLHNFAVEQPDLNWWSDEVRREFLDILDFWFERGVAGFRIDVAHGLVKDRELRDNPPAQPEDSEDERIIGQRRSNSLNRPEVHDIFRSWRELCDSKEPQRVLLGETWALDLEKLAAFYGSDGDELHLNFNFFFVREPFEPDVLSGVVAETERLFPADSQPCWTASNHDVGRFPTRWCHGDERQARVGLMLLLTLRGTPVLYYGDELAMPDTELPPGLVLDVQNLDHKPPRDPCRTPMPWSDSPNGGFAPPDAEPWLPLGDTTTVNVESQRADPGSALNLTRALIALRPELAGAYERLEAPGGLWAYRRGESALVALNMGGEPAELEGAEGEIALCTQRERDGEAVTGTLLLEPWQGVVLRVNA
jgi:alpha-glucosidase